VRLSRQALAKVTVFAHAQGRVPASALAGEVDTGAPITSMDMYQHDSATMFKFVLRGELIGSRVLDVEHAWNTARSILARKELVVDISGVTTVDARGVDLLLRMRDSGARLTAALPPESEGFLRSLGVPLAAPRGRRGGSWALRFLGLAGLCR